jgi:hypothetical protein
MNRKEFLTGLAGAAIGAPLGAIGTLKLAEPEAPSSARHGRVSYSQAGEDVVAAYFFGHFKIRDITYLDIGAWEPILINNTYHFYELGHRGVLVEPNVDMSEKLRATRPGDTVLVAGIGFGPPGAKELADYYVMTNPSWSTFDKAEAEHQVQATKGRIAVKEVRKMPLLNINDVMAEHFKGKAPTYVSIDAEGLHFRILKSIDFERFRPPLICIETLISGESRTIAEIPEFMTAKGYVARGGSFVNTIFVDSKII